jgi:type VI secretion system protein ImpN
MSDAADVLAIVSARFSALWAAIIDAGAASPENRLLLIDRVRDALDRGHSRLSPLAPELIANSFAVEDIVHAGDRTLVLKLRQRDLGTVHALKTLPPERRDDAVLRGWLLHEGRLAGALDHPNIVTPRAVLRLSDGRPALLSDWMPETLSSRLAGGRFTASEIADLLHSLLTGLGYLHGKGIVHGDISPANLFFADAASAQVMIGDFGLALREGERPGDLAVARGAHPHFAAPEQLAGERPDPRSDLYSCGRILDLLMTRCGTAAAAMPELTSLAYRLTQSDPAHRPADAAAVLAGSAALCSRPGVSSIPEAALPRWARSSGTP